MILWYCSSYPCTPTACGMPAIAVRCTPNLFPSHIHSINPFSSIYCVSNVKSKVFVSLSKYESNVSCHEIFPFRVIFVPLANMVDDTNYYYFAMHIGPIPHINSDLFSSGLPLIPFLFKLIEAPQHTTWIYHHCIN